MSLSGTFFQRSQVDFVYLVQDPLQQNFVLTKRWPVPTFCNLTAWPGSMSFDDHGRFLEDNETTLQLCYQRLIQVRINPVGG